MVNIIYKQYLHTPPIVWLDTNVIINMRDALVSKSLTAQQKIFFDLYNILLQKVDDNKIICPFLGQRNEYSEGDHLIESDDILLKLSKGFQISGWRISDAQFGRMLENFINNKEEFELLKDDFDTPLNSKLNSKLKIIILQEGSQKDNRTKLFQYLTKRKQEIKSLNLNYDEIYNEEYKARELALDISVKAVKDHYKYFKLDFNEHDATYYHLYPLIKLKEITNITDEKLLIKKIKDFFKSEYFFKIPYEVINTTIVSKLLYETDTIKYSDIGDIENISRILPYASYIITEKRMVHLIRSTKMDSTFNTKIYNFKEIQKFIHEIEKL